MIHGHFIVLEGIDGSGTTTQASLLTKRFSENGLPAHMTAEPSDGPTGSLVRQILTGRIVSQRTPPTLPSWKTMALLFAADRQDHIEAEIQPNLREGVTVLCDRYVYSSIIYQSLSTDIAGAAEWIRELNRFAPEPDLVIYLQIPPEVAMRRRQRRDRKSEIYDDPDFQVLLAKEYDKMNALFPDTRIATIDSDQPMAVVTDACWTEIEKLRAEGAP